jgi:hypothetical protein
LRPTAGTDENERQRFERIIRLVEAAEVMLLQSTPSGDIETEDQP